MKSTGFIMLTVCMLALAFFVKFIIDDKNKKNQVIDVTVILLNNCELADEAFMVKSIPDGKKAKFENGITKLKLKRSSKVILSANDKFEGFHYSGVPVNVDNTVELIADCNFPDRLDNIFESLRDQFNN